MITTILCPFDLCSCVPFELWPVTPSRSSRMPRRWKLWATQPTPTSSARILYTRFRLKPLVAALDDTTVPAAQFEVLAAPNSTCFSYSTTSLFSLLFITSLFLFHNLLVRALLATRTIYVSYKCASPKTFFLVPATLQVHNHKIAHSDQSFYHDVHAENAVSCQSPFLACVLCTAVWCRSLAAGHCNIKLWCSTLPSVSTSFGYTS